MVKKNHGTYRNIHISSGAADSEILRRYSTQTPGMIESVSFNRSQHFGNLQDKSKLQNGTNAWNLKTNRPILGPCWLSSGPHSQWANGRGVGEVSAAEICQSPGFHQRRRAVSIPKIRWTITMANSCKNRYLMALMVKI